jgi:hypothetical protein
MADVSPDLNVPSVSIFSAYWRQMWPRYVLPSPSSWRPYMTNRCEVHAALTAAAWNRWLPPPTVSLYRAVFRYLHTINQPLSGLLMHTDWYSLSWSKKFLNSARFSGPPCTYTWRNASNFSHEYLQKISGIITSSIFSKKYSTYKMYGPFRDNSGSRTIP